MKKLKTKNFRYIKKKEIEKPLHCLHQFYREDIPYEDWRMEVELLLFSGLDGRLKRNGFEYGLTGQRLIKQIEIGYVLYVLADIKNSVRFQRHMQNIQGMFGVLNQGYLYQPTEALLLFFGHQSLKNWTQQIEWVVNYASLGIAEYDHASNDDSLLVYNRIMALVDALYHIYCSDSIDMDMLAAAFKRRNEN